MIETITQAKPVEAWRVWRIHKFYNRQNYYLYSLVRILQWGHGKPFIHHGKLLLNVDDNTIEDMSHSGIHAWKTQVQAVDYFGQVYRNINSIPPRMNSFNAAYPLILGKVYLGGEILEHEFGYRATEAYPAVLYTPDTQKGQQLAQDYGCEVVNDDLIGKVRNQVL